MIEGKDRRKWVTFVCTHVTTNNSGRFRPAKGSFLHQHTGVLTQKIYSNLGTNKVFKPYMQIRKCDNYKVCTVHVGPLQINGFKLTGITRTQQAGQGEQ